MVVLQAYNEKIAVWPDGGAEGGQSGWTHIPSISIVRRKWIIMCKGRGLKAT